MTERWEAEVRERYAELLARRAREGGGLPASLEEIQSLAATGADTPERIALLDRVLADPRTRDEYLLLRDVVREGVVPHATRVPRWLAAAAGILLVAGAGIVWRAQRAMAPEPMRGDGGAVELLAPAPDAVLRAGTTFVWRSVAGAEAYELELTDEEGASIATLRTSDTTLVLPDDAAASAPRVLWWITARLRSGDVLRSSPRPLRTDAR
jgi:hypothetical protein